MGIDTGRGVGLLLFVESLGSCSEELQSPSENPHWSSAHSQSLLWKMKLILRPMSQTQGMLPTHGRNVSLQNDSALVKPSVTCGSITINCTLRPGFVTDGY